MLMPSVVVLSVIHTECRISFHILNVVMLSVVMLNVVLPSI
jgi:hypothetical protein